MANEKKKRRALTEIPLDAPVAPVRIDRLLHRPLRVLTRKRQQAGATRMVNVILREVLEREGLIEPQSE